MKEDEDALRRGSMSTLTLGAESVKITFRYAILGTCHGELFNLSVRGAAGPN
jgi:hypothetical protein